MVSRRSVLISGGAMAVVAGVGAVTVAHGPGAQSARAPWTQAGESFGDPRLDALAYAILAPNPHNRQPWAFKLVGQDEIEVYCDLDRRLPHTDPFDRQTTIGFGCMLELLRMAAAEKGYAVAATPFPEGVPAERLDTKPVARVVFSADKAVSKDTLFAAIPQRRTTREPFDTDRPVSADVVALVLASAAPQLPAGQTIEKGRIARITDIAKEAWTAEYETDATRRESIELMRIGNKAVAENPDGISLGGLMMGLLKMAGMITPKTLDTPGSQAYQSGFDMYTKLIETSQGFIWLTAPENTRQSQLEAGRDWVRLNLAAQQAELAIHPLSQALQEFPEMAAPYRQIHEELGVADAGVVHMLGRIGYAKFPDPAPRWPLTSRLLG